jgi:hypothetical protein
MIYLFVIGYLLIALAVGIVLGGVLERLSDEHPRRNRRFTDAERALLGGLVKGPQKDDHRVDRRC